MSTQVKQQNKLELMFIVSGTPVELDVNVNETLGDVFERAIKKAGIAGEQKPADWDFTFNKVVLEQNKPIREFGFAEDAQIFLTRKVGGAG